MTHEKDSQLILRARFIASRVSMACDAFQGALMALHCPGGAYTLAAFADLHRDAERYADAALEALGHERA